MHDNKTCHISHNTCKGLVMEKEKILEISRKSKQDEGMEYAENQGRKIGYVVISALYIVLVVFSLFFGQTGTLHAMFTLFWAFVAAEAYGKYRFTGKKTFKVTVIAGSIASVCFLACFIIDTLG